MFYNKLKMKKYLNRPINLKVTLKQASMHWKFKNHSTLPKLLLAYQNFNRLINCLIASEQANFQQTF